MLAQDAKVVDVSADEVGDPYDPTQKRIDNPAAEFTWKELISFAFSVPFQPNDELNYVPTQYLAETLKAAGFDGVKYGSSLDPAGFNLALFDPCLAEIEANTYLKKVQGVKYEYS